MRAGGPGIVPGPRPLSSGSVLLDVAPRERRAAQVRALVRGVAGIVAALALAEEDHVVAARRALAVVLHVDGERHGGLLPAELLEAAEAHKALTALRAEFADAGHVAVELLAVGAVDDLQLAVGRCDAGVAVGGRGLLGVERDGVAGAGALAAGQDLAAAGDLEPVALRDRDAGRERRACGDDEKCLAHVCLLVV